MDTAIKIYSGKTSFTGKSPLNVLHIIKSLGRGGAETLLAETLNEHDRDDFNFHYIFFLPWKDQMVKQLIEGGGTVTCMPAKNNAQILLQVRRIARYIKQHQIHLIHCHLPVSGVAGRLAGGIAGVPVVYTEHNTWERYHKVTYWLNRISFSKQKKVIAVSMEVAKSIKAHYHKKLPEVLVIPNGVDTRKYSREHLSAINIRRQFGIPDDAVVIGVTCVFRAQKRLHYWLEIAAALKSRNPRVYFIIVGDGVLRQEVYQKADELNTSEYVHFAGLQTEVRPYLEAMDIFMMCSDFEGLPIALLEAMSMGCVPACTGAGGIPEVINDGVNGILVPVDEPLQLVERITACLAGDNVLENMKAEARKTVIRSFGMKKMVSELEAIYHNTTDRKSQS